MSDQLPLISESTKQDDHQIVMVPLDSVASQVEGIKPSKALVRSMCTFGLFEPILVTPTDNGLIVVDGKRRVAAAIELCWPEIEAKVYSVPEFQDTAQYNAAVSIITNSQRSSNPLAEAKAIAVLMSKGYDEGRIAFVTGMPIQTIRKRVRLIDLPAAIAIALEEGKISAQTAEQVSKLPAHRKEEAVRHLEESGELTQVDIKAIRMTGAEAALQDMPLFAISSTEQIDMARSFILSAMEILPGDHRIQDMLTEVMRALDLENGGRG